jgi:hypothetical protein
MKKRNILIGICILLLGIFSTFELEELQNRRESFCLSLDFEPYKGILSDLKCYDNSSFEMYYVLGDRDYFYLKRIE